VAIMHNDVDMPFPKPGQDPYQVLQLRDLISGILAPRSSGRKQGLDASCAP
jgi:hypothetical protein